MTDESRKFYELVHPGGPRGLVLEEPKMQEQDKEFEPGVFYAVIFFPKITGIGKATGQWPRIMDTLSNSPEAAKTKFMDGISKHESWQTYVDAGHKIRRVKITDLGDAELWIK